MNCIKIQESLVEYQLAELDAVESALIEEHLSKGCPECRDAHAAILEGIDLLFEAAPNTQVADAQREAILLRAERNPGLASTSGNDRVSIQTAADAAQKLPKHSSKLATLALSLASLAAGWISMMIVLPPARNVGQLPAVAQVGDPPAIAAAMEQNRSIAGVDRVPPALRLSDDQFRMTSFVSLHQPANASGPNANIVWDPLAGEIHFFGFSFPAQNADHEFVVWARDQIDNSVVSAVLEVDDQGQCSAVLPASQSLPPHVLVTSEINYSEVSQPSQDILLIHEV